MVKKKKRYFEKKSSMKLSGRIESIYQLSSISIIAVIFQWEFFGKNKIRKMKKMAPFYSVILFRYLNTHKKSQFFFFF